MLNKNTAKSIISFIVILTLTGCGSKNIAALEGYELNIHGPSGYGFINQISVGENSGFDSLNKEIRKAVDSGNATKLMQLYELQGGFKCTTDKTENIKNGDQITIACKYDEKLYEKAGWSVSDTSKTFTVNGLEEPELLDLWEDIELEYEYNFDEKWYEVKVKNNSNNEKLQKLKYEVIEYDPYSGIAQVGCDYFLSATLTSNLTTQYEKFGFMPTDASKFSIKLPAPKYFTNTTGRNIEKLQSVLQENVKMIMDYFRENNIKIIVIPSDNIFSSGTAHSITDVEIESLNDGDSEYYLKMNLDNGHYYRQMIGLNSYELPDGQYADYSWDKYIFERNWVYGDSDFEILDTDLDR